MHWKPFQARQETRNMVSSTFAFGNQYCRRKSSDGSLMATKSVEHVKLQTGLKKLEPRGT